MATIYEISEKSGVSPKTVARILAGTVKRSKNMEKVLAAAKELGYVRNQQAASLRSGRSGIIGVIVPGISNPAYTRFVEAVHEAALKEDYHILLSSNFGKVEEEVRALQTLQSYRADAIILNSAENEMDPRCEAILESFHANNCPIVLGGEVKTNLEVDRIKIENKSGVQQAMDYLVKTGRKKIAMITGPKVHYAFKERYEGYKAGLKKHKLPLNAAHTSFDGMTMESGREQTLQILKAKRNRPDAIVAGNDLIAYGCIRACFEMGLKVPEDIAIVGFDDIRYSRSFCPSLTTLRQPKEQIGQDIVQVIMQRLESKDLSNPRTLTYTPELISRESA